jgi:collagenase-like PrtC family protease
MKITAPISKVSEIAQLALAGADEFYCGVVPPAWVERFNNAATSRRLFSNLQSLDELAAAVEAAHGCERPLSLALNGQHYADAQHATLLALIRDFAEMGGDAVIIGDIPLLAQVADAVPDIKVHVSSVASCRNSAMVSLCRELGSDRIIFPRFMQLDEMAAIRADHPGLSFEAFVLNDGCIFEEGACHTLHLPTNLGGAICIDDYVNQHARLDGVALSPDETAALAENDAAYRQWQWYRMGCGSAVTSSGLPYGPCGLCAIAALAAAGVGHVKIAGRDAASTRKVVNVQLVRQAVDKWREGGDAQLRRFAQSVRGESEHCAHGYMCYYPEARMAESPIVGT